MALSTILTYFSILLAFLFLAGQFISRGGILESLSLLRGRGIRIALLLIVLFLGGGLIWRATFSLSDEVEERITRGTEPGDSISVGYDTKSRFISMSQPLGRVFDRNGLLLAGYVVRDHHLLRYYPAGGITSHLVGYWTGPIRDGVGVEKGLVYLNDSLRDNAPHDLSLSIDLRLQDEGMKALNGKNGAIVLLDANNGEVLAAASNPVFDPNRVTDQALWTTYSTDKEGRPLIARAIKDNFSPGSSIKPLIAAAAISYGTELPEGQGFSCTGTFDPGPGIPSITDHGAAHGRVDLSRAMRVSCNTYFSYLADRILGFDRTKQFLERFGANKRLDWNTGIFLNRPGALRIAASRVEAADPIAESRIGIGQASVKLNPLHAAVVFGGIASGGLFFAPSLELGRTPDTLSWHLESVITDEVARLMLEPLKPGGTASGIFDNLKSKGITVYGKTGTADREPDGRVPSWFSSFGERNGRRYVVIVAVEDRRGSYAGGLNAPMARKMYESLERFGYFR